MDVQYQWQLKEKKNTNFNQLKDISIKYEEVCDFFPPPVDLTFVLLSTIG